jgi:pilus assembly protein CpaB
MAVTNGEKQTRQTGITPVRASTIVMIGFAVLFGLLAVFVAQSWLNSQAEMRMRNLQAQNVKPQHATQTIVVANKPLRYGAELAAPMLREIPWSQEALPKGAFTKIDDVLKDGKRVVLAAIEPNEPVLSVKITGPGQRATLSALVGPGMKAVTIRVNDVDGVGGFVLPGDHVDIALTRQVDKEQASTQVILQHVRVLAIDQIADERTAQPTVAKSVTLEVDNVAAQKLGLAASIGSLSLLLRKAGDTADQPAPRVTLKDLFTEMVGEIGRSDSATVIVRRGTQTQNYSVPIEATGKPALASATRR